MKLVITAAACGIALLSGVAQAQNAEAPVVVSDAEGKSSNELALLALAQMKAFFSAASEAKDVEAAKVSVPKMEEAAKQLAALEAPLKKAAKPSDDDIKALAVHMVAFENEMKEMMGKMMQNMVGGGEEVQKVMGPVMENFGKATAGTMAALEANYPEEKMKAHIDAIKKEQAEKEGATKTEEAPAEKVEAPKEAAPEAPKKAE